MAFLAPKTPSLPPAPVPPTKENTADAAEAARQEEAAAQAKRRGRARDILTGSGGVADAAPTVRKQLLGA